MKSRPVPCRSSQPTGPLITSIERKASHALVAATDFTIHKSVLSLESETVDEQCNSPMLCSRPLLLRGFPTIDNNRNAAHKVAHLTNHSLPLRIHESSIMVSLSGPSTRPVSVLTIHALATPSLSSPSILISVISVWKLGFSIRNCSI